MGDGQDWQAAPLKSEWETKLCPMCGSRYAGKNLRFVKAVTAIRVFGITLRRARPAELRSECSDCGVHLTHRPGTIRVGGYYNFEVPR